MAVQNWEELNNLATIYYDKMKASAEEKKKRVDLALEFAEIYLMLFAMIDTATRDELVAFLEPRINVIADRYIGTDDLAYVNGWSRTKAEKSVDVTLKNLEKVKNEPLKPKTSVDDNGNTYTYKPKEYTFEEFDVTIPESEYWTSDVRGLLLGIDCATCISNYYVLYDALQQGKTRKVWITEADERVRRTHREVDHVDIPILDLFVVGNSYMLFPGDAQNGADESELANCRCWLETY